MLVSLTALLVSLAAAIDVPFVPTSAGPAAEALDWIHVGPNDNFIDLGCGDGRVAAEALRRGANVTCVELRKELAEKAVLALANVSSPSSGKYRVLQQDLFHNLDLSQYSVVFFYLLPDVISQLRPMLTSQLRDGARILSREFEILGFPCGERLRALDHDKLVHSLFLTWTIGRFDLDEETERTSTSAEEHLMDCHAEEAVEEQSESESEPSGGRARIGRMYSSRGRVTAEFE